MGLFQHFVWIWQLHTVNNTVDDGNTFGYCLQFINNKNWPVTVHQHPNTSDGPLRTAQVDTTLEFPLQVMTTSSHARKNSQCIINICSIQVHSVHPPFALMQLFFTASSFRSTAEGFDEILDPCSVRDKVFLVNDDSFGVSSLVDDLIWILRLLHHFLFFL